MYTKPYTMSTAMIASIHRPAILRRMGIDYEKIRALREKLDLSQEQAAKAAGFKGRATWNHYETGRREPRLTVLEKIAAALGVKARDLLK